MITLSTADNALKTVYLGVIGNQLNVGANPLLAKIKQTTNNIYGNQIKKLTSYGLSGGVSAGTETGALPAAYEKPYSHFELTLKNLYGTLEISDKAIRCSQNNAGAFVNLLNDEMENLIKSSSFNLGRMLYGDGSGIIASIGASNQIDDEEITLNNVKNVMIGSVIRMVAANKGAYTNHAAVRVTSVDKSSKKVGISAPAEANFQNLHIATLNGLKNEITGLGKIFDSSITSLYGLTKSSNEWLNPYTNSSVSSLSESKIQTAIDEIEENTGAEVDFITCSSAVRRAYQDVVSTYRRNVDVLQLDGGFKAISYNGIPVVADRFVADDTMYLLTTKEFEMCQLGDWQWIENNDGKIITQKQGYPTYTATLVKYAELLCNRPNAQAKLSGITV